MAEQQLSENVDNLIARGKVLQQQSKHAEALTADLANARLSNRHHCTMARVELQPHSSAATKQVRRTGKL